MSQLWVITPRIEPVKLWSAWHLTAEVRAPSRNGSNHRVWFRSTDRSSTLTSIAFASILLVRGGHVFQLSFGSYVWAAAAGLCIGGAEITYLYLFGGIGAEKPMAASLAIPTIVSGTIVIALVVGAFVFKESLSWAQGIGGTCIILGIFLLYIGRVSPAS